MNRTSAAVCPDVAPWTASLRPTTRLASPGAPGWTMGGVRLGALPRKRQQEPQKQDGQVFRAARQPSKNTHSPASSHTVAVQVILIALGGALGSVCRYGLTIAVQRLSPLHVLPYGTFAVNVLGCLVFGILVGAARQRFVLGPAERAFFLIGVLGGFTTFSTFTYDTFALLQDGELYPARR